jgi:hypothetical protein
MLYSSLKVKSSLRFAGICVSLRVLVNLLESLETRVSLKWDLERVKMKSQRDLVVLMGRAHEKMRVLVD